MSEVTTLFEDSSGVLWVGTTIGLGHLTDKGLVATGRDRTLFHEKILGIAEDHNGWLWMTTPSHTFKVRRTSLLANNVADADVRVFDEADGLRAVTGVRRSRSVVSGPDGMIWVATSGGLAMANPRSEGRSSLAAIPHIEQVLVEVVASPHGMDSDGVVSAAAQKRIAFDFTGLSFRAPERVRYRYRLDGFDRGWSEPTAESQAIYTNLSPGKYEFRVMASDSDGQWSPMEAVKAVRILPRFWQTWWFQLTLVLMAAFATLFVYRLRMRAMVRRSNLMLEERLTERTRIAQELHDTLLQGFFSASMQLRVVADRVEAGSPSRLQLDRIVLLMGKVLDQGRDAVKGLRSGAEDSVWLEDTCRALARDLGGEEPEENVEYQVLTEGNARELRHGVQSEVGRIVQEALANATRHAQATRIEVWLHYQPQALRVAVRDNGVGVSPEILAHGREGHWGLPGMRERAESVGGTLEFKSSPGNGTSVELAVPANAAYRRYMKNGLLNWMVEVYRARATARHR
jgi:signal transduction histidine kinase